MTNYEKLVELVKDLNKQIVEVEKFATDNGLEVGQYRYKVGVFEAYDPENNLLNGRDTDGWGGAINEKYTYNNWIGSSVCC